MKKKLITKPAPKTEIYYDWDDVMDYMKKKYKYTNSKISKIWDHLTNCNEMLNGKIFTISNWDLVHNNGQFSYLHPEWYIEVIKELMEEFGKIDEKCLTPNTKTANFKSSW